MVMRTIDPVDRSMRLFKAFADPTRLRLLNLLRRGERCVCDLIDIVGGPQPRISRHLAYLKRAGLVAGRKEGQWVHYRLTEPGDDLHRRLIDCIGCCFGEIGQLKKDMQKLERKFRELRCCESENSGKGCGC